MEQRSVPQTLEDRLYRLLADQIGRNWEDVWRVFRLGLKMAPISADLISDLVFKIVTRHAYVQYEVDGDHVFDRNLFHVLEAGPLTFGQMYVHPISERLAMVGYQPPGMSSKALPPMGNSTDLDEVILASGDREEKTVRRISNKTFLCKRCDGRWYQVTYDVEPKRDHFENPDENFGHSDHLRRPLMDGFGYSIKMLNQPSLEYFNLIEMRK